jgi:peptide deformylase
LRHKARPLTQIDKDLRLAVGRMFELMYEAVGLGLAATQVALPHQLLVMNMTGNAEEKDQECVYINPVIVERKGYQEGDEGCLSFPGLFQKVRRAKTVKVQAYDMQGQLVELTASDLEARAWQHELDHLDGVLYIDKFGPIAKLSARGSLKEFEREFRRAQERGEIPANLELEKVLAELAGQS